MDELTQLQNEKNKRVSTAEMDASANTAFTHLYTDDGALWRVRI